MNIRAKHFTSLLLFFLFVVSIGYSQTKNLWTEASASTLLLFQKNSKTTQSKKERIYKLDINTLKELLKNTSLRNKSKNLTNNRVIVPFPNKNGEIKNYIINEAHTLSPELQAKFPNIKSYIGVSNDTLQTIIRFSLSNLGLHSMKLSNSGNSEFIDPYTKDALTYKVYAKNDTDRSNKICNVLEKTTTNLQSKNSAFARTNTNDGKSRLFRLALSCTGEYSQFHIEDQELESATDQEKIEGVLSAMNVSMTRINGIFEKEMAISMQLVANNDELIFLDPDTDGYTSDDDIIMLTEVQNKCNSIIGSSNYDMGHLFTTGFSGLAELSSPCTSKKAQAVSGRTPAKGDAFDIDFVAHEMGHQFGATHTFNNSCGDNTSANTAFEPGSGSTIMGYAGICAPNVQAHSDAYFHGRSLEQMYNNIVFGNSTCSEQTIIGITPPTANAGVNYSIPIATPFALNGEGTSGTGAINYCWEQTDNEQVTMPPLSNNNGGPLFRSLAGTNSTERHFPAIETTLAGETQTRWEVLPSIAREMNFKLTIRDEGTPIGQFATANTKINVIDTSTPFKITSQTTTETLFSGTSQVITWNISQTNLPTISTNYVNILLSTDGGLTFPITLVSNVVNNGSHNIIVPSVETTKARIKVAPVDNIFYSINSADLTIDSSKFIMSVAENPIRTCIPNNAVYEFEYNTYSGFNEETTFSATNLPVGTMATFNPTKATADGTNVTLTISNVTETNNGVHQLTLLGTSLTEEKSVNLVLYADKDIDTKPYLTSPANDAKYLQNTVNFAWNAETELNSYTIDIATDIEFSNIVESSTTEFQYHTSTSLNENQQYYWRVKEINECMTGENSLIYKFKTGLVEDFSFSETVNTDIPDNDPDGISATINITDNIKIEDITINLNIQHPYIGDIQIILEAPTGEKIILVEHRDYNGEDYTNTTFDDMATLSIPQGTAPFNGSFKPAEPLSTYKNIQSTGDWNIYVSDNQAQDEGEFLNWKINIIGINQGSLGTGETPKDNSPKITKAFSPNGDGINDNWTIENINTTGLNSDKYPTANIKVFNTQGQLIFQSNSYKNDWDGTGNNGSKLPIGTYIYEVSFSNPNYKTLKGWLYLKY